MDSAVSKLQYKENFDCLILNNPPEFDWSFPYDQKRQKKAYDLELLFVRNMHDLNTRLDTLLADKSDTLRWIAYPKKSGNISSDLSRDIIWKHLEKISFQPVAMVSLDDSWSAMRVRHSSFVKVKAREKMTMPQELRELLGKFPDCQDYFASLSNTNQKEYIRWIISAKREKTLKQRLEKTKMLLQDKVPNPFARR